MARDEAKVRSIVPPLLDWFALNARDLPWRRTRDPYAIWVSEIMLQQTQVNTVIPYWDRWMRELPTIQSLAAATTEHIHKLWEGLGYYTRVRNLQETAQRVVGEHGGSFPNRFEDVFALPGIGRYTAGAVCSIAFNQPTPILDGNVIRVLTRVFGIREPPREKKTNQYLWGLAARLVSTASEQSSRRASPACSDLNESLMELGALICKPRQPECKECPIAECCYARIRGLAERLPNLEARVPLTPRKFAGFVFTRGNRVLVRQRPGGVVNAHLWEFPNVELNGRADLREAARDALGFVPEHCEPLCRIRHSITRYHITLEVFTVKSTSTSVVDRLRGEWIRFDKVSALAFPSAHRKLLGQLLGLRQGRAGAGV